MRERILVRLCSSFVWIYFARYIYAWDLIYYDSLVPMIFYIGTALCITLFLEAFHYLMIDYIKYSRTTIVIILLLSGMILYTNYTHYYLSILVYIDFVMIKELIQSYEMYKSLRQFQTNFVRK